MADVPKEIIVKMYETMLTIRRFEERVGGDGTHPTGDSVGAASAQLAQEQTDRLVAEVHPAGFGHNSHPRGPRIEPQSAMREETPARYRCGPVE